MGTLSNDEKWRILQTEVYRNQTKLVFEIFRREGIEPILIKGLALSQFYPNSHFRSFSDIDIAVASENYEDARTLEGPIRDLNIRLDLHREMKNLDSVPWKDLYQNSITFEVNGTSIRTLRPEDHLRVVCAHWLNDSGTNRERLWDVYYAVDRRPADFDWDRCLKLVDQKRQRWVTCSIGIASKYLGLNIDDLWFASEARNLPTWLIRALEKEWESGVQLQSIDTIHDPVMLLKQIKKRIPPNPVQATIEMGGSLDAKMRIHYQIGSFLRRLVISIRRISRLMMRKN